MPAAGIGVQMLRLFHARDLLGARLLLMLRLPVSIRHAVNALAGILITDFDTAQLGLGAKPFRQAVAAKAGQIHQIDILHVAALLQVGDQVAKGGGFNLDTGIFIHENSPWATVNGYDSMHATGYARFCETRLLATSISVCSAPAEWRMRAAWLARHNPA